MAAPSKSVIAAGYRNDLDSIRDKPHDAGYSLPGHFYTDPCWLQVERDELFARKWVCVGRLEEVAEPGDYFAIDHVGEPVLVVHGDDGKIRALANVCRHRGTVIVEGSGNAKKFMCPYHHWAYATDGRLLNAPHMEERTDFDRGGCRLPELACEFWQGFIFVSLDPEPSPLAPILAPLQELIQNYHLEKMRLRYLAEEIWYTNWKCLLENFMEGYHLTPLHRNTLHNLNPSRLCKHIPPGEQHFGYTVGFTTRVSEARIGHADLTDSEMDTCIMFAVPPGLTVGVGSDYCSFLCIRPHTPSQVRVKMGLFFQGDDWSQREVDQAVELFQKTMDEDKQVLVRLQQGLESRHYAPGPLASADLEGTIWDFYQYLSRNLGS